MRVIDLLNKIANGEEIPEKFKYKGETYIYRTYNFEDGDIMTGYSFEDGGWLNIWRDNLNDEVAIIKDKKIRKIKVEYSPDIEEKIFYEDGDKPRHCVLGDAGTELLINKINEITDVLNEMREDK